MSETLAEYLKQGAETFVEQAGGDLQGKQRKIVLRLIKGEPGIKRRKLLQHSNLSGKDFLEAANTLLEIELIRKEEYKPARGQGGYRYYPVDETVSNVSNC